MTQDFNDMNTDTPSPFGCKCTDLARHILGDGCSECNPEMAEEIRRDNEAQAAEDLREEQNERLKGLK